MAEFKKRKKKNGKISYTVCIRIKGRKPLYATFDRLTDAKIWAGENESRLKLGKKIKNFEANKHTLTEAIDRYIEFELPKRKSDHRKMIMHLTWWKKQIGFYLLSDIVPSLLSEQRDILAKEPSRRSTKTELPKCGATVNRYMASLSIVLSKAFKEWEWIEENPMLKVSKFKENKNRVRFLSQIEQQNLLGVCKECSELLYLIVVLALSTGARYGELIKLCWDNIKFFDAEQEVTLYFLDTKNGENRSVTIDNLGYKLLKQHSKVRHINSNYIFARTDGLKPIELKRQWEKALKISGITDFRFHDLRHTTASNLAMNGVTQLEIADVLGHKTLQMVKRYAHLSQNHSKKVLKSLNSEQFKAHLQASNV